MRVLRFLVFVLFAACQPGASKAPITHEDVWLMPRVGAPAVSPDGKWVVVSVTEPSYEENRQSSDLWIVPVDGSAAPRRFTSNKAAESGVVWAPDSSRIAFVAKREGDEVPQVYILPLSGGEAYRLTSLSSGAAEPQWRPDGKALLFQSRMWPGAADDEQNKKITQERKERKYNVLAFDSFPIRRWDKWVSETRPHIWVQDAEPGSVPRNLLGGTKMAALPGFYGVESGLGDDSLQAVWARDGRSIVFAASINRNVEAFDFSSNHIYRIAAEGGEPVPLTSDRDSYSSPAFRPDGKALLMKHRRRSDDRLYSLTRLAMVSWPDPGKPVLLGSAFDRSVDSFTFTPDSRTIYLTAEEHGHDKVFTMAADGGSAKPALPVSLGGYANLAVPEKASAPVLIANFYAMTSPPEVVRVDPTAGTHTPLTQFTAERTARIDWQPPRHFWFTSKTSGRQIHNLLVLPPAFDESKKYPLLVFMHGGPHNMWKDQFFLRWNFHYVASPGYVLLMTNYTGSSGFGEDFAEAINRDVLRGPANEINEAADEAIRRFPFIDAARQAAGGASYGGYLANWMQGHTTRYRTLFNHAGLTSNVSMWGTTDGGYYWERRYGGPAWEARGQWREQDPFRYAGKFRTPMLITHGANDFRVPLGQGLEIYKLLQRLQVPSRLLVFPDENHWILKGENNRYFFQELFAWLKHYLDPPEPPVGKK